MSVRFVLRGIALARHVRPLLFLGIDRRQIGLVTGLCLSAATAWVMWEAVADTRAEMQASAERVAREARFSLLKTVRNYHYGIKQKIGADNDAHLVWLAVNAGLIGGLGDPM